MLNFQRHGQSIQATPQISFNNLCSHFNLPENPLKDRFKNILWKMDMTKNGKFGLENLHGDSIEDEFIVYCAWDVAPLHR